jgi:hypothetical protein
MLFGGCIGFGIWMFRWQYSKADRLVTAWAQRSHYQILTKESANPLGTGPMARGGSNKQVMCRVTLLDSQGTRRHALVKVGSEASGVLSDNLTVTWEESANN